MSSNNGQSTNSKSPNASGHSRNTRSFSRVADHAAVETPASGRPQRASQFQAPPVFKTPAPGRPQRAPKFSAPPAFKKPAERPGSQFLQAPKFKSPNAAAQEEADAQPRAILGEISSNVVRPPAVLDTPYAGLKGSQHRAPVPSPVVQQPASNRGVVAERKQPLRKVGFASQANVYQDDGPSFGPVTSQAEDSPQHSNQFQDRLDQQATEDSDVEGQSEVEARPGDLELEEVAPDFNDNDFEPDSDEGEVDGDDDDLESPNAKDLVPDEDDNPADPAAETVDQAEDGLQGPGSAFMPDEIDTDAFLDEEDRLDPSLDGFRSRHMEEITLTEARYLYALESIAEQVKEIPYKQYRDLDPMDQPFGSFWHNMFSRSDPAVIFSHCRGGIRIQAAAAYGRPNLNWSDFRRLPNFADLTIKHFGNYVHFMEKLRGRELEKLIYNGTSADKHGVVVGRINRHKHNIAKLFKEIPPKTQSYHYQRMCKELGVTIELNQYRNSYRTKPVHDARVSYNQLFEGLDQVLLDLVEFTLEGYHRRENNSEAKEKAYKRVRKYVEEKTGQPLPSLRSFATITNRSWSLGERLQCGKKAIRQSCFEGNCDARTAYLVFPGNAFGPRVCEKHLKATKRWLSRGPCIKCGKARDRKASFQGHGDTSLCATCANKRWSTRGIKGRVILESVVQDECRRRGRDENKEEDMALVGNTLTSLSRASLFKDVDHERMKKSTDLQTTHWNAVSAFLVERYEEMRRRGLDYDQVLNSRKASTISKVHKFILERLQRLHLETSKQMQQAHSKTDPNDIEKRYEVAQSILRQIAADTDDSPAHKFSDEQIQQEILRKDPSADANAFQNLRLRRNALNTLTRWRRKESSDHNRRFRTDAELVAEILRKDPTANTADPAARHLAAASLNQKVYHDRKRQAADKKFERIAAETLGLANVLKADDEYYKLDEKSLFPRDGAPIALQGEDGVDSESDNDDQPRAKAKAKAKAKVKAVAESGLDTDSDDQPLCKAKPSTKRNLKRKTVVESDSEAEADSVVQSRRVRGKGKRKRTGDVDDEEAAYEADSMDPAEIAESAGPAQRRSGRKRPHVNYVPQVDIGEEE